MTTSQSSSYVFLAAAAIVWGGAFVAGRMVVTGVDPLAVAWLRFVIASLAFAAFEGAGRFAWRRRGGRGVAQGTSDGAIQGAAPPAGAPSPASLSRRREGPSWALYAVLGLSGVFAYNCFFFYGLTLTGASESSLIIASSPVVVAVLSSVFLGEGLGPRKTAGILLSVAGVAVVVVGAPAGAAPAAAGTAGAGAAAPVTAGPRLTGDLLMLGAVFSWAVYSLLGKRVLAHVGAFTATSRAVWWGTLFFSLPVLVKHGPAVLSLFGPREVLSLLYLGLVSTVFGFVAWYRGLSGTEVSRAAVFLNLVPVSTLTIAAFTLGERPGWLQLLGGLMVITGVWMVTAAANPTMRPPGR